MGSPRNESCLPAPSSGAKAGRWEGAMSWTKPEFDEIKMDAEAKSYSGEDV
jgi:hypothetical protein